MTKTWILVATEGQAPDRDDRNIRAYAHEPDAQAALDRLNEWISERRDALRRRRYDDGPPTPPPDDDPRFRTNGMDAHTIEWWIDMLDLVEAPSGAAAQDERIARLEAENAELRAKMPVPGACTCNGEGVELEDNDDSPHTPWCPARRIGVGTYRELGR